MALSPIPPIWLTPTSAQDSRSFLPPPAPRGGREPDVATVLCSDADTPVTVQVENAAGHVAETLVLRPGELAGLALPRDAGRLVLRDTGEAEPGPVRLGHYPLGRWALLVHALRYGTWTGAAPARQKALKRALRTLRRRLKQALWTSSAASLAGLPDYRRFRARHVGDFAEVPPPGAAPRLAFLSAAAGVTPDALAACARALDAQTDPNFRWILALPPGEAAEFAPSGARVTPVPAPDADPARGLAAALEAADDDEIVVPLDAAGTPTRDAVALLRATFARHPDCALAYTDEEYLYPDGALRDGAFKPAYNRHLLEAMDYMGALVGLRGARARALGLRPAFGAAARYDLLLRYLDGVPPAAIRHLPRVAYSSVRAGPGFADGPTARLAAAALAERLGVPVEVDPLRHHLIPRFKVPAPAPLVSIVIPTRDRAELLARTLETLVAVSAHHAFEIIIVDNGSHEEETFALFERARALWPATRILTDDGDFNFSRLCNAGIAAATGELVLLLNNDMEIVEPGWLGEMVALACRPGVGIVGAKLLYPDRSVQHAGFIVGLRSGAGSHWFAHAAADAPGYQDRLVVRQNLSAVTGACLLVRRDCLEAVGLLDEEAFAEECNDIDLCLRTRQAGWEVVFTPFARLIHHESASRGTDTEPGANPRRLAERERFAAKWATDTRTDPHLGPNFRRDNEYALRAPSPQGSRAPRTDAIE
ncbi:glycosyltransferase family 2 protein [Ancylobacter sp. MQZ15Z-1]|uniref:Glycosyltransferase family 2 protein n=1 Tax=Ancylobacter mangrovi TaxID=2972472 RepID=A0A9X2PDP2_9HYPH|nr:glycosyltransferase family 2 protein [Ancylobacter mangrovi]MCS0495484.1 glycosyltransferase family 2 protein [Ancylobacter mangrovi]